MTTIRIPRVCSDCKRLEICISTTSELMIIPALFGACELKVTTIGGPSPAAAKE